jgi:hypothetical protein
VHGVANLSSTIDIFLGVQDLKQRLEQDAKEADHRLAMAAQKFESEHQKEVGTLKGEQIEDRKGALARAERESEANGPEDGEITEVPEAEDRGQEQSASLKRISELKRKIAMRQLSLVEVLATTQAEVRATAWAKAANTLKK